MPTLLLAAMNASRASRTASDPFYWRLINCAFGVICIIPLIYGFKLAVR